MRFATRAFAFGFVPFALVLGISFWALQSMVRNNVRDQLRTQMGNEQTVRARSGARSKLQVGRFLRFAGESAALKSGLQLLNSEPASHEARHAVEGQLRDLGAQIGFKFLSVADSKGAPVAWIIEETGEKDVPAISPAPVGQGLMQFRGQLDYLLSAPIDQGGEKLGYLTVGERFELSDFNLPMVLMQGDRMLQSSLGRVPETEIEAALHRCGGKAECEVLLGGSSYLSLEMQDNALGSGYQLRSLQNIDAAAAPLQSSLRQVFLAASLSAVFAALLLSAGASQSMVQPLTHMIAQLRKSEEAGVLVELPANTRILEIRDLIRSFNCAASSIRDARGRLQGAYVEFVGSLANALDARDRYTAGHSLRVSQISASIAHAMNLSQEEQETIRVGALLHDIGKIGIPDAVLQKPGVLSDGEFMLIKQHPSIGCRILEGVNGLTAYLPAIEFHHENWDGSGYPRGLREHQIPLEARIIHIADAWDAMTTDRPYRQGFSRARALAIITLNAGKQFDPEIASLFTRLMQFEADEEYHSILRLAAAIGQSTSPAVMEVAIANRT